VARPREAPDERGAFDPVVLRTPQLHVYLLCREIHGAPRVERTASPLARVQQHFQAEEPYAAIELLESVLQNIPLGARQPFDVDRERFAGIRELRRVTQQQLACWLGVTAAAISHFEARGGRLRLAHLLLAAEWFDVDASQFVAAKRPRLAS
jgi:DNA-binding transcriptional regulator YiaG